MTFPRRKGIARCWGVNVGPRWAWPHARRRRSHHESMLGNHAARKSPTKHARPVIGFVDFWENLVHWTSMGHSRPTASSHRGPLELPGANVRFWGKNGHSGLPLRCLLLARSGHWSPMRGECLDCAVRLVRRASVDCHHQLIRVRGRAGGCGVRDFDEPQVAPALKWWRNIASPCLRWHRRRGTAPCAGARRFGPRTRYSRARSR